MGSSSRSCTIVEIGRVQIELRLHVLKSMAEGEGSIVLHILWTVRHAAKFMVVLVSVDWIMIEQDKSGTESQLPCQANLRRGLYNVKEVRIYRISIRMSRLI